MMSHIFHLWFYATIILVQENQIYGDNFAIPRQNICLADQESWNSWGKDLGAIYSLLIVSKRSWNSWEKYLGVIYYFLIARKRS
jgi:hypothetical protein